MCRLQPSLDGILQTLSRSEDLLELLVRDASSGIVAHCVALLGECKNLANSLTIHRDGVFQGLNGPHVMARLIRRNLKTADIQGTIAVEFRVNGR